MRLFVFARHAESVANVAHVISSDPAHPAALTRRGRGQARKLGAQLANLEIDIAFCTRFLRTRQTIDVALRGRAIPVLVEPGLDEVQAGVFDGAPIQSYWAWKERHAPSERFPHGESLDEAVRRYFNASWRAQKRSRSSSLTSSRCATSRRPPMRMSHRRQLSRASRTQFPTSSMKAPYAAPWTASMRWHRRLLTNCTDREPHDRAVAPPARRRGGEG
jgi:hypothetical protein